MNDATLLHRQIHPSWVQSGRVTRQAFKPTAKDGNRLSVYDGDMVSAEEAWLHYTDELQFASVGVLSVTQCECATLGLPVASDPSPFPSHAIIDFSGCANSQIEKQAKRLILAATARGWQYQADESP
jgi:hypothetical protein